MKILKAGAPAWAQDGIHVHSRIRLSFWDVVKTMFHRPLFHQFVIYTDSEVTKHKIAEEKIWVAPFFPPKKYGMAEISALGAEEKKREPNLR